MALDKIRLAVEIADATGTRVELKPSEAMMLFDRIAELEKEIDIYKAGSNKLEEMVEQFQNGEAAYELGRDIDENAVGDIFRIGYAYAAFYDLSSQAKIAQDCISIAARYKARIAELERVLKTVLNDIEFSELGLTELEKQIRYLF